MSTEVTDKPEYRACISCGRPVFADLLDERGVCDYCREIRMREDTIPSRYGKHRRKKRKTRDENHTG